MSGEDTEFREAIKHAIRKHDPDPDDLRDLSSDLDQLADEWEQMEATL